MRASARHVALNHLLRHVGDPSVRLVALTGAAGMGKSRLLDKAEECLGPEYLVVAHRCLPSGVTPGGALGGLLSRLNRLLSPDELIRLHEESGLRRLFSLCPELRGIVPDSAAPVGREFKFMPVLEGFVALLDRLARHRPLVISLDDLHHIDESSRSLLDGLLAHPTVGELRLTLLVGCRDLEALPFITEWESLLGSSRGMERVTLGPLDRAGMAELVADELDQKAAENLPEVLDWLERRSAGQPFLALQLLRHARRSGLVRATLSGWQAATADVLAADAPACALEIVAAPLLARQPLARFLLTLLEAVGRPVALDCLMRATSGQLNEWGPLAEELQRLGVLRRADSVETAAELWEFSHALFAEDVAGLLEPAERSEFLLRTARALDDQDADERLLKIDLLCCAWQEEARAGGPGAEDMRLRAARLALTILEADDADGTHVDLRLRLAERVIALDGEGYSQAVRTLLEDNIRISSAMRLAHWLERADFDRLDAATRLLLLQHYPRLFAIRRQPERVLPWIEGMASRSDLCGRERAALVLARLQHRYVASDWAGVEEEFALLEALDAEPAQKAWGMCLRRMAPTAGGRDHVRGFLDLEQSLAELGKQLEDHQLLAVYFEMHNRAHLCGQRQLMKPHYPHMIRIAEQAPAPSLRLHRDRLARVLVLAGRLPEAERLLRENLQHLLRIGEQALAVEVGLSLVNLLRRQHRLADALAIADLLDDELDQPATTYVRKSLLLTTISLLWRLHRREAAGRLLERAGLEMAEEAAPEFRLSMLYCRAMIRLQEAEAGGDWRAAAQAATDMSDFYREMGRGDTETLMFAAIRDRAQIRIGRPDAGRRAADYLPAVETAILRCEFDLVRFLCQVGELALDTGEASVAARMADLLADAGHDQELAAQYRLSRASHCGDREAAAVAMLELACHCQDNGQDGLVDLVSRRFPDVAAWPMPPVVPARVLCLWAWTLANCLETGRPVTVPGLGVVQSGQRTLVRNLTDDLTARHALLESGEQDRLDRELDRVRAWLDAQEEVSTGPAIEVLGAMRLLMDGREVDPQSLRTRAGVELLALLAVRAWQGRTCVAREEILEALVLDGRPLLGEGSLRVVISRLRKALQHIHPDIIQYRDRVGYLLAEDLKLRLDVADFDRAWVRAQEALHHRRHMEAGRHLDLCLALYRGCFMPGGATWSDALRGLLERRFMDAARQRLALLEGQEDLRHELLRQLRGRLPALAEFLADG